ncbi:MAG TPA: xanthine dehydrogenase accessory protein XdhC [Opitutaceae bacterium]|jgi:xanthine dehydrogenase accessory factor
MTHDSIYEELTALERDGVPFVLVTLVETLGSTPQDAGAKMIVLADGLHGGTVGGGRIEAQAIAEAQKLLSAGATAPQFANWSLKGDVGMTCGGSVKLYFEPHRSAAAWPIVIFGAGHIAQALLPVLLPLRCRLTLFDTRPEWLDRLPAARNLSARCIENLADQIPGLPDNAFVLFMTRGHATDRPGLQRALAERNFPFVGVIGSEAKAAILRREMIADGLPEARAAQFHCPLGLDFGTNDTHEIALSIAAQLLTVRDRP